MTTWKCHPSLNRRIVRKIPWFLSFVLLLGQSVWPADIVIRISGPGSNAKYLGPGQTTQSPVTVRIGDRLIWSNESNTRHTATASGPTGTRLFDTGAIPAPTATVPVSQSSPIPITSTVFQQAGGVAGQTVTIDYFCDIHGNMEAKLIVDDRPVVGPGPAGGGGAGPIANAGRIRRDITTLSATELQSYRDAWRQLQISGAFQGIAANHGCPLNFCHTDRQIFLPWHREYLLRLETALGTPLHYWDWTSPSASAGGVPSAFTASAYVSADGNTRPNPLLSFRFRCSNTDPITSTNRLPQPASLLSGFADSVRSAYLRTDFIPFSTGIEDPHGSFHVWVGGNMSGVDTAAYDPLFWAHHSNVDRQWASWQAAGRPNPLASVLAKSLPGFAGRTAADVVNISTLGYAYDRLDMIGTQTPFGGVESVQLAVGSGVGKSFAVESPSAAMGVESALQPSDGSVELVVGGLEAHPSESLFVYVFANQPNATVEDATPSNPKFLGSFGIFGGPKAAQHQAKEERPVVTLPPGFEARIGQPITEVTLVVVDSKNVLVSKEQIPFDSVRFQSTASGIAQQGVESNQAIAGGTEESGWKTFIGTSNNESYDEAYRNAVDQAYQELTVGRADGMISTKVIAVEGTRGGIAGFHTLSVRIQARLR